KLINRSATSPLQYYRRAARAGNRAAIWNLHVCYAAGLGVDRNPAKARYWRRRSEEYRICVLDRDRQKIGVDAFRSERIYPLPVIGPIAVSSYEELSAAISDESFAQAKPRVGNKAKQDSLIRRG